MRTLIIVFLTLLTVVLSIKIDAGLNDANDPVVGSSEAVGDDKAAANQEALKKADEKLLNKEAKDKIDEVMNKTDKELYDGLSTGQKVLYIISGIIGLLFWIWLMLCICCCGCDGAKTCKTMFCCAGKDD